MKSIKKGDQVKSSFRSRWKGVVTKVFKNKENVELCSVVLMLDSKGNPQKRRIIKELSTKHLSHTTIDQKYINQAWL